MFQFPGFPVPALCVQTGLTGHYSSWVSPFGNRWIDGWLAPTQRLSQPPTSFFGSRCQGIHRMPLLLAVKDARARYGVLKDLMLQHVRRPTGSSPEGLVARFRCVVLQRRIAPSELHKVPNQRPRSCSLVTTLIPRCRHTRRHDRCGRPPRRRSSVPKTE